MIREVYEGEKELPAVLGASASRLLDENVVLISSLVQDSEFSVLSWSRSSLHWLHDGWRNKPLARQRSKEMTPSGVTSEIAGRKETSGKFSANRKQSSNFMPSCA